MPLSLQPCQCIVERYGWFSEEVFELVRSQSGIQRTDRLLVEARGGNRNDPRGISAIEPDQRAREIRAGNAVLSDDIDGARYSPFSERDGGLGQIFRKGRVANLIIRDRHLGPGADPPLDL